MVSSSFKKLRSEIRTDFRDELGSMFSDEDLDTFLNTAQMEYCLRTGCLSASCEAVTPFGGGALRAPTDFLRPVHFDAPDGTELQEVSWRELGEQYDFRRTVGDNPRFVCYDFDTWGLYRVYPCTLMDGVFVGTLHYKRTPKRGLVEIRDTDALRDYALYLCFMHAGKEQAASYLSQFEGEVNQWRSLRGSLYPRRQTRPGIFY